MNKLSYGARLTSINVVVALQLTNVRCRQTDVIVTYDDLNPLLSYCGRPIKWKYNVRYITIMKVVILI